MTAITEASFVDLYLGNGYSDVKGLHGATARRVPTPDGWEADIAQLRERCMKHFGANKDPEFSLIEDGVLLRVTQFVDPFGENVFVLRKSNIEIRDIQLMGFPNSLLDALLSEAARGLVVICGDMGVGKTSTAVALLVARLKAHGGIAIAAEDPQETNVSGVHGQGRCIQMQVSRATGGYEESLTRALRTGADMIYVGEIRDPASAAQIVRASINGNFIITTGHGGSISDVIERIASLAEPYISNAREILAKGLIAVVYQNLENTGNKKVLKIRSLVLTSDDGLSIREKIRSGHIQQIEHDVENQAKRSLWG
ncbi:ATPase, T2SS/T4P/T4SS family [Pseudomonas sp. NPDC088368]|uniref:ATPase, T2SS/T4P/T4SS family n=1 Tax=Pseudomonas sp. NPDC088368 TaxID=3364453 RepID=UPI0038114992